MHTNGRVYDPQLGRVLPAGTVAPDATGLQAYNHYAYVRNNPLSLLDPLRLLLARRRLQSHREFPLRRFPATWEDIRFLEEETAWQ